MSKSTKTARIAKPRHGWNEYRRLRAKLAAWRAYKPGARPLTDREDRRYFNLAATYG